MADGKINMDFVGVVAQNDSSLLEYQRVPIKKLYDEEFEKFKAMAENDNRSVLDLQDYFQRYFPVNNSSKGYNYCAPYSYSSAYVSGAMYPSMISFESYQNELKQAVSQVVTQYIADAKVANESFLSLEQRRELEQKKTEARENNKKNLRRNFYGSAMRYVSAFRFYETLKTIKADSRNKMYSTETIGWTDFKYPVGSDILFQMKSNFGYGNSSYHFINLTYKGIDILPYSALVQYYWVSMVDFIRYTRQYRPSHDNWEPAFDFVVETANLAISDETEFITKWIGNEIDEMVAGLRIISNNPKQSLKDILNKRHSDLRFLFVRDALTSEKRNFEVYPDEASIAYKAEKISCALDFLEKLEVLKDAYPKALEAIDEIKRLNLDLLPNINEHVERIEKEIKRRQAIVDEKVKERDRLKAQGKPHFDEIERQIAESRSKGQILDYQIRTNYINTHPDFKILNEQIDEQSKKINEAQYDINMRRNFVVKLNDCKAKVERVLNLAA